jgi:prepilin-type N-terminal cleavage/methylation domain-containing protein
MIRRQNGFTLIEIMIVVLIIAMLLAIAIPNFLRARDRSRAKACQSNLRMIVSAKEQWAMDNMRSGTDTPTAAELVSNYIKGTSGTLPECPSGGVYSMGTLNTWPSCSIGTNATTEASDDHIYIEVGG